jgi:hypothetical protein
LGIYGVSGGGRVSRPRDPRRSNGAWSPADAAAQGGLGPRESRDFIGPEAEDEQVAVLLERLRVGLLRDVAVQRRKAIRDLSVGEVLKVEMVRSRSRAA